MLDENPNENNDREARVFEEITPMGRALRKLNELNAAFYARTSRILREQLTEETLEIACAQRKSEARRGVPFQNWSFEVAIGDAVNAVRTSKRGFARRGGTSKKTDALQEIIIEMVRKKPLITTSQALVQLMEMTGGGIIERVEDETNLSAGEKPMIEFRNHHNKTGMAPISGLKDRLYRAKKALRAEIALSS